MNSLDDDVTLEAGNAFRSREQHVGHPALREPFDDVIATEVCRFGRCANAHEIQNEALPIFGQVRRTIAKCRRCRCDLFGISYDEFCSASTLDPWTSRACSR